MEIYFRVLGCTLITIAVGTVIVESIKWLLDIKPDKPRYKYYKKRRK